MALSAILFTRLVLSCDADVIVPALQLTEAAEWLRAGMADMVYPFSGVCIDISKDLTSALEREQQWDRLTPSFGAIRSHPARGDAIACCGGALMLNLAKFAVCGIENERFVGWGGEDDERHWRLTKLGMKALRTDGPIYHLKHRIDRPAPLVQAQYLAKLAEYSRSIDMSREQLEAEIRYGFPVEH